MHTRYTLYDLHRLFCNMIFFGPVALLVRTQAGVTLSQFFLLQAILACATFLWELPAGWLTDRIGYRNTLILESWMFFLCRALMLAAFLSHSFPLFVLEACIEGTAYSFCSGTESAYLYAFYGESEFLFRSSRSEKCATAGFLFACLAYLVLYRWFGILGLLTATLSTSLCAAACALLLPREPDAPAPVPIEDAAPAALGKLLRLPALWAVVIAATCIDLGFLFFNFFYVEKLLQCGLDPALLTPILLGVSALKLLAERIITELEGRNPRHLLAGLLALSGVGIGALGALRTAWGVLPLMLALPLMLSLPLLLLEKRKNQMIDGLRLERQRATVLSVMNMGVTLTEMLFLFGSGLLSRMGLATCFLLLGGLTVLAGMLFLFSRTDRFGSVTG